MHRGNAENLIFFLSKIKFFPQKWVFNHLSFVVFLYRISMNFNVCILSSISSLPTPILTNTNSLSLAIINPNGKRQSNHKMNSHVEQFLLFLSHERCNSIYLFVSFVEVAGRYLYRIHKLGKGTINNFRPKEWHERNWEVIIIIKNNNKCL